MNYKKLIYAALATFCITACSKEDENNNNQYSDGLPGHCKITVGAPVDTSYEGGASISRVTVFGDTGASVGFKSIGDPDANGGAGNYSTTGGLRLKAVSGLYQAQQLPIRENMPGQDNAGVGGKILLPEPRSEFTAISGSVTIKAGAKGDFLEGSFSCQAVRVTTLNEQDTVQIDGNFRAVVQ